MMANGYDLGGEQSGHYFRKHATTGDGILTSLMVMEVMLEKKQPLSVLADEVTIYPQLLKNVRVADKKTAGESEGTGGSRGSRGGSGHSGRILVRESGTEPVIRVMVEAENDNSAKYVEQVVAVMEQEGLVTNKERFIYVEKKIGIQICAALAAGPGRLPEAGFRRL